jgi:hypothetical protein
LTQSDVLQFDGYLGTAHDPKFVFADLIILLKHEDSKYACEFRERIVNAWQSVPAVVSDVYALVLVGIAATCGDESIVRK